MPKILRVTCSAMGPASRSLALADHFIDRLRASDQNIEVAERILLPDTMPHFRKELFSAIQKSEPDRTEEEKRLLAFSDQLCAEVLAADTIVLAVPTYNMIMPSTLKAWIEHINRPGITFAPTENGPRGLLKARAVVICARGGFAPPPAGDFHKSILTALLNFFGVQTIDWVAVNALQYSPDPEAVLAGARSDLDQLAAGYLR